MRFRRGVAGLLVVCLVALGQHLAWGQVEPQALQSAQSTGNGTSLAVLGLAVVTVSIQGTAGANRIVTFQGSVDGQQYADLLCTNTQTGAMATSATASGTTILMYRCPVSGFQRFQTPLSGGTTGTVTVFGNGSQVSASLGGGAASSVSAAAFPLLAPNATAAAPSYSFASGPGTGFYYGGANNIGIASNGVLAAQITGTTLIFPDANNVPRLQLFTAYGVGMDGSDLVIFANASQGVAFRQGSVGGSLFLRLLANGIVHYSSMPLANLGANLTVNGMMVYCADCAVGASCAAGSGAFAKRINGANVCN